MNEEAVLELGQQAMITAMTIAAPILIVGATVGLLVGIFQALTQIQDHTLSFVPKILAMILVLTICLPWFIDRMVEFSRTVITNIPTIIGGG